MARLPENHHLQASTKPERSWSHKEKWLFLPILILVPGALVLAFFVAADLYLHNREIEGRYGLNTLNIWGYRGDPAPPPTQGQLRIAVVGGSTAWGYGVPVDESMPFLLQEELRQRSVSPDPIVLNLAYNMEGAFAYSANLEDYLDLDYDVVLMYTGVNDVGGENRGVYRRSSPIFRATGYLPVLPSLVSQYLNNWRSGRGLENPEDPQVVFSEEFHEEVREFLISDEFDQYLANQRDPEASPNARDNTSQASTADEGEQIPSQQKDAYAGKSDSQCTDPWEFYCGQIARAITFARSHDKLVLVVSEPILGEEQAKQQQELRRFVEAEYSNDSGVMYTNLGAAIDPTNPDIAFDGMHLTAEGNRSIARQLVRPIKQLLELNE